ncbi:alpha/beta hydrolase [Fontisphaera persica]|uniref:alpha/beta hydrolase n=1 Tax=Fontisphaera persica TaxID=2974023 RepID=UPI0024BFA580|nr:alpha/beta hydrolase [Fontisphaera persica]WCJ57992.1 alpha/beta hydrolase [Fontisphaera persica]
MNTSMGMLMLALVTGSLAAAPAPITLPLWPATPPGDTEALGEERDTTNEKSGMVAGRRVMRLAPVARPTLTFYPAPAERNTRATVLICPGGAYHILAWDLEGTEVAEWLNSVGINAVLLKYRVPIRKNRERWEAPLEDAQRAMGLVRARAREWNLDPQRLGVLGFSAGGHLCAVLSTRHASRHYAPVDEADKESCRPDFAVLVYPAYLTVGKDNDAIAPELTLSSNTPPTFLVQTQDDAVRVENSVYYYLALKKAGVAAELHIYPRGGHGYGLRPTDNPVTHWPRRVEEWLRAGGWLKP